MSNDFLRRNRSNLIYYSLRWSNDPLHHPTRQYEYPYVHERLNGAKEILDAGSGVTFFPYYVSQTLGARVTCCDRDAYVGSLYEKINAREAANVAFDKCDLANLPYEDARFDAVYCISVLEHTGDYENIVNEFARVLKPGGKLIVTFDISLDGLRDIPLATAEKLLTILANRFETNDMPPIEKENIYTSEIDKSYDSLFWRLLRGTIQLRKPRSRMTIYCTELSR